MFDQQPELSIFAEQLHESLKPSKNGEAPFFYGSFLAVVFLGALVLLSGVNTVRLNVPRRFGSGRKYQWRKEQTKNKSKSLDHLKMLFSFSTLILSFYGNIPEGPEVGVLLIIVNDAPRFGFWYDTISSCLFHFTTISSNVIHCNIISCTSLKNSGHVL